MVILLISIFSEISLPDIPESTSFKIEINFSRNLFSRVTFSHSALGLWYSIKSNFHKFDRGTDLEWFCHLYGGYSACYLSVDILKGQASMYFGILDKLVHRLVKAQFFLRELHPKYIHIYNKEMSVNQDIDYQ